METITLRYSRSLVRAAVRAWWWKVVGWTYLAVLAVLTAAVAWLLATGERGWYVGVLGAVTAMGLAVILALYVVQLRRGLARLARMTSPEATLKLDDTYFWVTSDAGETRLRWSLVTRIWRFDQFWLLFFSPGEFVTLPTADLTEVAKSFIAAKVPRETAGAD